MVNLQETGVYPYGQEQPIDEDKGLSTQGDGNPPSHLELRTSFYDEEIIDNKGCCSGDFRALPEDRF